MHTLQLFDLSIVIAYLVICLIIGLYNAAKVKSPKQFATGYPKVSTTILVCTIFVSSIGAGSTLGVTEKIYIFGAPFVIRQLLSPISWFITARIVAPNIE